MTKPEYEAARKLRISIEAARKRWKKESDAACSPHGILNLDAKAAADAIYAVALHYAQNEYVDTVVREAISMPRASKQDSKQDCVKGCVKDCEEYFRQVLADAFNEHYAPVGIKRDDTGWWVKLEMVKKESGE